MPRKKSDLLSELAQMPWWVSVTLSGLSYILLKYILPNMTVDSILLNGFAKGLANIAHFISLVLLIPAPFSVANHLRKKKLIKTKRSLDKIKTLDWKSFEDLVGEAFRQTGFVVEDNTVGGADGGVDLWLRKGNERYIAQCKRWKNKKVGVAVVREMYGIMSAENADGVYIISSGNFTQEAISFAVDKPIHLINGNDLVSLINDITITSSPVQVASEKTENIYMNNVCPSCGSNLILRTAKKGAHTGVDFWGCSSFPKCRFSKNA